MLGKVGMEASSNNSQSRHTYSPVKSLHTLSCHSAAVCMRRTKTLLVFWNGEIPDAARNLGRGENLLFRYLKKFELSSAARNRYRSMCGLDRGNSDLPEIRQSLCDKNTTAKS